MNYATALLLAAVLMFVAPMAEAKSYSNVTLNGQSFDRQPLQNSMFLNSELNQSQFRQSDLTGSSFTNTDLINADFSGAVLRNVSFLNAKLNGANFAGATFENVSFTNVELAGAHFQRNQLAQATMINTSTDGIIWIEAQSAPVAVVVEPAPRAMVKAEQLAASLAQPGKKIDLTVNFEFNSDKILAQGHAQVDEIAQALKSPALATARIRVEGHTDAKGDDAYNKDLSFRRAISVKRELTEQYKVNSALLTVEGFGETQPVASNETDEGRALNRRVTLVNIGNQ